MKRILIISDGKAGHLNQSIAFCKIKNISYDILEVKFKSKTNKLLSYAYDKFGFFTDNLFHDYKKYYYDFYDAIVCTGSGTYYFGKYISKNENKKLISLMLPKGYKYDDFYYIISQKHDASKAYKNLIEIPLNLSFPKAYGILEKNEKKKSLGIIIGGGNKIFTFDLDLFKNKIDFIFKEYPNHLKYITTSRRTSPEIEDLINSYDFDYKLIYSKEPNINPIGDFINICDEFFVTVDSTSMISEIRANTDKKINMIDMNSNKKNTKYHKLIKVIDNIDEKIDFKMLLKKIEI